MPQADDLLDELRSLFPEAPPPHALPFGKLLEKLQAEGAAVTAAGLRERLAKLVAEGKWKRARVGVQTFYWANKKPRA